MRNYVRKRDAPQWTQESANDAIQEIRNGMSIREASRKFKVPKTCLIRRLKQNVDNVPGPLIGKYNPVFSKENEQLLVDHLLEMQSKFYGLTPLDVRRVAYELAERLKMKHPFNNTKKVAGEDWLSGFLKRNPQLSIRKPEATSLNRAAGFNKDQVSTFFSLLKALSEQYNFSAERIYNFDETGISTVPKPRKILAKRGQKQVGRIVSGERGSNITMACAFSVTGHYIPPLYLFPRKRLAPSLLRDAPPGAIGFANGSGWMDSEHFLKYHKGEVTIHDVVSLSGKAFQKVATIDKATKGFERSGIYPYNPDVFEESDFLPSTVHENDNGSTNQGNITPPQPINSPITPQKRQLSVVDSTSVASNDNPKPSCSSNATPSTSLFVNVLHMLSPVTASDSEKKKGRERKKKEKSVILTSTPVKDSLEEKRATTNRITAVKRRTDVEDEALPSKKGKCLSNTTNTIKKGKVANKNKKADAIVFQESSTSESEEEDDCKCIFCRSYFKDSRRGEGWIRCQICEQWAHEACAGADEDDDMFICELCK